MAIFSAFQTWLQQASMSAVEYTALAFYLLTALLLVFTYFVSRQDWAEIGVWASLASVVVAIHFMLVGWREMSLPTANTMRLQPGELGRRIKDCAECPQLVVIQSGYFVMGADDVDAGPEEGPLRRMMIGRRFAISEAVISPAEWAAYAAANGNGAKRCKAADACLSWQDAKDYVQWLSGRAGVAYRLPSSSEWEYAARAGVPAPAAAGNIVRISLPAASRQNAFGLTGLAAGTEEFVEDCWSATLAPLAGDGRALVPPSDMTCRSRVLKYVATGDERRFSGRRPVGSQQAISLAGFRVLRDVPSGAK